MILFDKPYVSEFLRQTIRERNLPVVATAVAREFGVEDLPSAISERQAAEMALGASDPLVYTVSESSIGWIAEHMASTGLPAQIERFKNKARFRADTASLFPGIHYCEVALEDLDRVDASQYSTPFIIKPTVGFFSLGVKRVATPAHWPEARNAVKAELSAARDLFPSEVLSSSRLLIESCIPGREFAVDAYYDKRGEPVILSIFEHLFASETDTTDRVYVTSAEIVKANLERFTRILVDLGRIFSVRNFPVHVELRVDEKGGLWPIEVNPLRFGGWCTTADLTFLAYGVNPYACLFEQKRPNWNEALHGKQGQLFSIIALGNTTGIEGQHIRSFDYDDLLSHFESPLELRRIDFRRYPVFGFVFTQTRAENSAELDWALGSDLREFITVR